METLDPRLTPLCGRILRDRAGDESEWKFIVPAFSMSDRAFIMGGAMHLFTVRTRISMWVLSILCSGAYHNPVDDSCVVTANSRSRDEELRVHYNVAALEAQVFSYGFEPPILDCSVLIMPSPDARGSVTQQHKGYAQRT